MSKDSIDDQMEKVLDLMTRRSRGEATNDQIEVAVTDVLAGIENNSTVAHEPSRSANPSSVQADTGNYDTDEEADVCNQSIDNRKFDGLDEKSEKDCDNDEINNSNQDLEIPVDFYQEEIALIPLGKQGAQMMTTFGDGPRPLPASVSAALQGTRKCLQVAVMDARALRRQAKQKFQMARKSFAKRSENVTSIDAVDPDMLYRAFSGYDKLSYDPKCGFDMEQLKQLYPEEMRAYTRWKDMHAAYNDSSADEKRNANNPNEELKESEAECDLDPENGTTASGHLQVRAAQFDLRTEKMKHDWYMKFAKVRQGSFLPRGNRFAKSEAASAWDKSRRLTTKKGRPASGVWENMPANSVQFLHWLGFQPPAIPPPNEETTHALAFLGYDFLGKITEKVSERVTTSDATLDTRRALTFTIWSRPHPSGHLQPKLGIQEAEG